MMTFKLDRPNGNYSLLDVKFDGEFIYVKYSRDISWKKWNSTDKIVEVIEAWRWKGFRKIYIVER